MLNATWHLCGPVLTGVVLAASGILMSEPSVVASPVEVVFVKAEIRDGSTRIAVTLRHADTGWAHFANLWVVESPQGKPLGRRVLMHPHVDEQPFTRGLSLTLPPGIKEFRVRAGCNVSGLAGNRVTVVLSSKTGDRYELVE